MKTLKYPGLLLCLLAFVSIAYGQTKNGFDLSDASVPVDQIRGGGVSRDAIQAIDNPKFVSASDAGFLKSKERVLGVFRNDVAKAYPIRILNYHEIVNDSFGDEAIVVSYCPLCYTGMVFIAQAADFKLTFGVSGLLYNSDVLLYDRQTDSLWSQIMSKAITGPLKGLTLSSLPASHTTWRDWAERHPDTLVLSTDTGYRRDYHRSPYLDYTRTGSLMFPVENKSNEYRNKTLVLGVTLNGQSKVYPFKELEKNGQERFDDSIDGRTISVEWFPSEKFARILDKEGEELPSVIAYWFAWYAFHPDSEIFHASDRD